MRVLGWIFVAFGLLFALALNLERMGVGAQVRSGLYSHHDGGRGFDDGRLVWSQASPERITLEELPSLEGRLRGRRRGGDFVADEMSWYGVSLRECLAYCLDLSPRHVDGDEALDGIWLDVDASRVATGLGGDEEDWSGVEQRVLEGVLETYGLSLERGEGPREVVVLSAGPGWAEHIVPRGPGPTSARRRHGRLVFRNARIEELLALLRRELDFDATEGFDLDDRCDVMLSFDAEDPGDLARVLAEECDLHLVIESRDMPHATVRGVPTSPITWGDEDRGPPR